MGKRGPKRKYSGTETEKRRRESARKYRASEKGQATKKKYYDKNHKDWYKKSRMWHVKYNLRAKYGLTLEDYDNMLEQQKGVCAICGGINPSGRRLAVDHDHKTGEIRGLLCQHCNTHLGWYETCKQGIENYLNVGENS